MEQRFINIVNAREHNLKNVSVKLPIGRITLVAGDSGSGKSTLAFDILYAEARRKYLEALSLDGEMLPAPKVSKVEPALAAVALKQNLFNRNPRSLVSTSTGIGNIIRSVFELAGKHHCPVCGAGIDVRSLHQVLEELKYFGSGTRIVIKAFIGRIFNDERHVILKRLKRYLSRGFLRFEADGRQGYLEDLDVENEPLSGDVFLVIDRLIKKPGASIRLADSLRQAVAVGNGVVEVDIFFTKTGGERQGKVIRFAETPYCFECGFGDRGSQKVLRKGSKDREKSDNIVKKISGLSVQDILGLSIEKLLPEIKGWILSWQDQNAPELVAATTACNEILMRLKVFKEMGLGYVRLNTPVPHLSCGEQRKLQLASVLFQKLTGLLFVIDEPLSCLDESERQVVREKIKALKDQGNTIVVVEHDRVFQQSYADWIIMLGPGAGERGGEIIFQGPPSMAAPSLTGDLSSGVGQEIRHPARTSTIKTAQKKDKKSIFDAEVNIRLLQNRNLKEDSITLPAEGIVGICGPSGSGKTALANAIFYGLTGQGQKKGTRSARIVGSELKGSYQKLGWNRVLFMDENLPRGSSVSVIATFVGIYSHIATLLSRTPEARARGITRSLLSLSKKGGRCEKCKGTGRLIIEPEFLQPVEYVCDACKGKRYSPEVLTIEYKGASIGDLMEMTVSDAIDFFKNIKSVRLPLEALERIGLGYLRLGQTVSSLSGGERQRLKLGSIIAKSKRMREFIILDNVSRGLSKKDITNILRLFNELAVSGHFLVLVDNQEIILENCTWLIKMGPGSGPRGGRIVSQGYNYSSQEQFGMSAQDL